MVVGNKPTVFNAIVSQPSNLHPSFIKIKVQNATKSIIKNLINPRFHITISTIVHKFLVLYSMVNFYLALKITDQKVKAKIINGNDAAPIKTSDQTVPVKCDDRR